jgi:golgin subfamily B member 1
VPPRVDSSPFDLSDAPVAPVRSVASGSVSAPALSANPTSPAAVAASVEPSAPAPSGPVAAPVPVRTLERPSAVDRAVAELDAVDWAARAERLKSRLDAAGDPMEIAALAYELGEMYARQLDDEARAAQTFGQAFKADASLRANLWAIRRIFYRRELWPNLVKLIEAEIRYARDDGERADLAVEQGYILEDRQGATAEARACYQQALSYDPGHLRALMALERVAAADRDEPALLDIRRRLADASTSPLRKLGYLLDLVRSYRSLGGEGLAKAREVMAEAVALQVGADRVAVERERLAELAEDYEELLLALDTRAQSLLERYGQSGAGAPPQTPRPGGTALDASTGLRLGIAAIRRRQARIARDQLGDAERAWDYLVHAMEAAPGEPLIVGDLADMAESIGHYEALATLCVRLQALEPSEERRVALELRRADALVRAGKHEDAQQHLDQLAAANPGYLPVTALAERGALATGDWAGVGAALKAMADAAKEGTTFGADGAPDPEAAVANYVAAGYAYAVLAGDREAARVCYGAALQLIPGYPAAVDGMASIYEQSGRPAEAAALLEEHADSSDHEFRRDVLERLVLLYEGEGAFDDAIRALQRLVDIDPDNLVARWRIEELLAALGRSEERAALLADLAAGCADPDRRAALLLEVARICDEEIDDPEQALNAYRRVLEIWPTDRYTRAAIAALLRRACLWEELAEERRAEAEMLEDGPAAARALREAAAIYLERLSRPDDAIATLRLCVDRMPDDVHANRALFEATAVTRDKEGMLEVLDAAARAQTEDSARGVALVRLADAQLEAGKWEDAGETLQRALEATPDSVHALLGVWHVAARLQDSATGGDVLERLGRSSQRPPEIASELLGEAGWLALRGNDEARASRCFGAAMELGAGGIGGAFGLVLADSKSSARRPESYDRLASALGKGQLAAACWSRAAALSAVAGRADEAAQRVFCALQAAPDEVAATVIATEFDMPAASDDPAVAWRARAELLRKRARLAEDAAARSHWNLEAAEALDRAGQLHDAGQLVVEVLRQDPDNIRGLQILRRLAQRGNDRPTVARASLELARLLGNTDSKLALLRQAAQILDQELADAAAAAAVYERILAVDPEAAEFERLAKLYATGGDDRSLEALLTNRISRLEQGPACVPMWLERGQARRRLGDARGAIADLNAILAAEPGRAHVLRDLATLYLEQGQASQAADQLRAYLKVAADPELRAEAELELARILAETMDDVAGAALQLRAVVAQKPDDPALRDQLASLLLRAGDPQGAVEQLRQLERLRAHPVDKAREDIRIAEILRDQIRDRDRAVAALERARERDPLNLDAVHALAGLADGERRTAVWSAALADARTAIAQMPAHSLGYERVAAIAEQMGASDLRFVAVSALDALGPIPADHRAFWDQRQAGAAGELNVAGPLSEQDWTEHLEHTRAGGALRELWAVIADAVARMLPHEPGDLGFARGDKVAGRHVDKRFPRLAKMTRWIGPPAFELYVSAARGRYARVVSTDKPTLFVSEDVAEALTAQGVFALGRALALLRLRAGPLSELRGDELTAIFAAAAVLAGVEPEKVDGFKADRGEKHQERVDALNRNLARKAKKNLALLAPRFAELGGHTDWAPAMLATASRVGLACSGALNAALDVLDVGRGGRSIADDDWGLDLLAWSVSDHHTSLRRQLGLVR